jgi:hypothetical protein
MQGGTGEPTDAFATPGSIRFRAVDRLGVTDADVARMLELLALSFDRWPLVDPGVPPADYLRWKMSSPAAIFAAVLGERDGELITTDTCIGHRVLLRGRAGLRVQFVDHTVRPDARGHGVSSASLTYRQRTLGHLYDLSISDAQSPAMIRRAQRWGTRALGNRVRPLVLPLRTRVLARRWAAERDLPRWTALPLALALRARAGAVRAMRGRFPGKLPGTAATGRLRTEVVDRFDDRIDRFFAAAAEPWDFIVVRSREHLEWRYCDPRGGRFLVRVAEDDEGAILGYAVARARGDRGYLVDLLALPDRLDVVALLAAEQQAELADAGCAEVLCWLPERHPYRAVLHRAGFLDARNQPHVTYRPCGTTAEELAFLSRPDAPIHFTLGDTDLV